MQRHLLIGLTGGNIRLQIYVQINPVSLKYLKFFCFFFKILTQFYIFFLKNSAILPTPVYDFKVNYSLCQTNFKEKLAGNP